MNTERRLTIPNVLEKVAEVCDFVVQEAEAAGLDERAVYHCQMAVDEWCTNIVEHGCDDDEQHDEIEVTCQTRPGQFIIHVSDNGIPFDPTTLAEVDPQKPLEEREPGGLGWFFIQKFMNQVNYEYKGNRNHLTMIKYGAQPVARMEKLDEYVYPSREYRPGLWVITPHGRLDSNTTQALALTLKNQLDAAHYHLIIDMGTVNYISSSGLKVLVSNWRKIQKVGGTIVLADMTERVREVFTVSGFDTLFTIASSVDEAVANIS